MPFGNVDAVAPAQNLNFGIFWECAHNALEVGFALGFNQFHGLGEAHFGRLHIVRYRHEFTFVAHIWTETADGDFNVRTLELTEAARKFEEFQRLLKSD